MVPVTADEIEDFIPDSLKDIAAPPVFRLKPATGRDLRPYRKAVRVEGLVYHGAEAIRAEVLKALKELWSEENFQAHADRLNAFWAAADQKAEVSDAEAEAIGELMDRLGRAWQPLRQMIADNIEFAEDSLKVAASMFVGGWSNVAVPYRRDAGRVSLQAIDDVADALGELEKSAIADGVEGAGPEGLAFMQLCNAASARLTLGADTEKNSESPSPSSAIPNGSTTTSSAKTADASSQASASSKPTRRGKSAPKIAT